MFEFTPTQCLEQFIDIRVITGTHQIRAARSWSFWSFSERPLPQLPQTTLQQLKYGWTRLSYTLINILKGRRCRIRLIALNAEALSFWLKFLGLTGQVRTKQKQDWQNKNYNKLSNRIKIILEKIYILKENSPWRLLHDSRINTKFGEERAYPRYRP